MLAIHQTRFFTAGLPSASKSVECLHSCFLFAGRMLHQPDFVCNPLSCKRTPSIILIILAFKKSKKGTTAFLPPVNRVDFQRNLS
jgi:hypothetical protein